MNIVIWLVPALALASCGGWAPPAPRRSPPTDLLAPTTDGANLERQDAGAKGDGATRIGRVSNADAVVAAMRPDFRQCYNRGLARNPTMMGSVRITAKVGPAGEVITSTPSGGNGLDQEVIACVTRCVQMAVFSPPEGGAATVVIPVTFAIAR